MLRYSAVTRKNASSFGYFRRRRSTVSGNKRRPLRLEQLETRQLLSLASLLETSPELASYLAPTASTATTSLSSQAVLSQEALSPSAQYIIDSANYHTFSRNPNDLGRPIVPLYTEYRAGGDYFDVALSQRMLIDANAQWAPSGAAANLTHTRTALKATWLGGSNGILQFHLDNLGPRDVPQFGFTREMRFWIKPDKAGQEVMVHVYRVTSTGAVQEITTSKTLIRMLTTGWQERTVSLPGLKPSDLYAITFEIGNGRNVGDGSYWLDDVRLLTSGFDPSRTVQSYQPRFWVPTPSRIVNTPAWRDLNIYSDHSYLYDNAMAIKVLLATGDAGAAQLASEIADGIIRTGLRDGSYFSEMASGHALTGGSGARTFSEERPLGANAWFGLALLDLYRQTNASDYLARARQISDWAEEFLRVEGPGTLGGYRGGWVPVTENPLGAAVFDYADWQSTEHNVDLFALNLQLADALQPDALDTPAIYRARANYAGDFVMRLFDRVEGKFWVGTTLGYDPDAERVAATINTAAVPLDAQTKATLAMPLAARYRDFTFTDGTAFDWRAPMAWAETRLRTSDARYNSADPFDGFTYNNRTLPIDGVWGEGTAQAATAYSWLASLFPGGGHAAKYQSALNDVDQIRAEHPNGDGRGVVASTRDNLRQEYDVVQNGVTTRVVQNLYDARLHVGATAWQVLAQQQVNPFQAAFSLAPNDAPIATVQLSTTSPLTGGVLTATATKTDPNGDPVTLTFVWKVNGVEKQRTTSAGALTDAFNLAIAGNGDEGDTVTVEVTPNDGKTNGRPVTATATVADTQLPRAVLQATNVTLRGGTTHTFQVTYTDNLGISIASIDRLDVRVVGPKNYNVAAIPIRVDSLINGTPRTVTYRIPALGGKWDPLDNGTYRVVIQPNQVLDVGNNAVPSGPIGSFRVSIGGTTQTTTAKPTLLSAPKPTTIAAIDAALASIAPTTTKRGTVSSTNVSISRAKSQTAASASSARTPRAA